MELDDIIKVGDTLSFGTVAAITWDGARDTWNIDVDDGPAITRHCTCISLRRAVVEAQHTASHFSMQLMFCESNAEWFDAVGKIDSEEEALNAILTPLELRATIWPGIVYFAPLTDVPMPRVIDDPDWRTAWERGHEDDDDA